MKLLPVIALLSCLIIGMMTSGIYSHDNRNSKKLNIRSANEHNLQDLKKPIRIDTINFKILQPSSGIRFFRDGIVFLSDTRIEIRLPAKFVSFGTKEAYYTVTCDSLNGVHLVFSQLSSFPYPCEALTFNSQYDTMYFTKHSTEENKEKIFMATYGSDNKNRPGWISELNPAEICSDNTASYSHPALSADGKIMVFASDIQESIGGMDLFVIRKEGGRWSSPTTPGKLINSPGDDFFPFLDQDNNLYFSSDGITGYGGYDIYVCRYNGHDWEKPVNLGSQVNSADDDIAFTINMNDGKTAFFTRRLRSNMSEMWLLKMSLDTTVSAEKRLTLSSLFIDLPRPASSIISQAPVTEKPEEVTVNPGLVRPDTVSGVLPGEIQAKDLVVYRVQVLSIKYSTGSYKVTVNNKVYDTYEYFYNESYRHTIGEFSSLAQAAALQNTCRQNGFPQAFVVAFKNNERSLDPLLFR